MIFKQEWVGYVQNQPDDRFEARVPGNIQSDYARAHGYGDVNYALNYRQYHWMEDEYWVYETELRYEQQSGERVFFVTKGIDYEYDVLLNGRKILSHEGMFSPVEADLTDFLVKNNTLRIIIHPMPKYAGASATDRTQAVDSCKPPVGYEWDWHPRLLCSGLWCDTYIETRCADYISECEVFYSLSDDYSEARVRFAIECNSETEITFFAPDGQKVYHGTDREFTIDSPQLWWCSGQGEAALYRYEVRSGAHLISGRIGFRKVRLVMNEGAWDEPAHFPKSRSAAPITIELNGRRIFAKGSNWVNPEIFNGEITRERYQELLTLAKEANMNLLRIWGGAIVNKEEFFEICDELGLMVWQEFPLACNNYIATPHYLSVLEQEATAIVQRIRKHACHVLWCGGNELFNDWSGMTEQSRALRLLDKICYEQDFEKPFIMASPLNGMGHGDYLFYDEWDKKEVFEMIQSAHCTAYTEFGVPSMSDYAYIKTFIPEQEIEDLEYSESVKAHHGREAWRESSWICMDVLERYFGKITSTKKAIELSQWLQCEGYKAIYEEARRQWPHCSMALNWCYCEPWKTIANNSLISYPAVPKPAYFAVQRALTPVLASARISKFSWQCGELFSAELWYLNDSQLPSEDTVRAYIVVDGTEYFVMEWETGIVEANTNRRGNILQFILPETTAEEFCLKLVSKNTCGNEYRLKLNKAQDVEKCRMN